MLAPVINSSHHPITHVYDAMWYLRHDSACSACSHAMEHQLPWASPRFAVFTSLSSGEHSVPGLLALHIRSVLRCRYLKRCWHPGCAEGHEHQSKALMLTLENREKSRRRTCKRFSTAQLSRLLSVTSVLFPVYTIEAHVMRFRSLFGTCDFNTA